MEFNAARARQYLLRTPDDPWRWAEHGNVIVWHDGSTIAFREELILVLEQLASHGLPPFQTIVLLLAACRGKFPPAAAIQLEFKQVGTRPPSAVWNDLANQEFCDLLARLRAISLLPAPLKRTDAKVLLIETVFDKLHVSRVQPGTEIVEALRHYSRQLGLEITLESENTMISGLKLVHAGLQRFSPAELELRMQTGLEQLPAAAELELTPARRARAWLAELQQDPEQQGLARVARDIMAALYVPRSLSELDELALGGFSDIANRGNLDRLLASELANDDLTLATRIALNEALYIRREPPSNHPPARVAILIDVGVRQWGLPRVFATAAAMAFIARDEHCVEATVWRARRGRVEVADLFTRKGLTEQLSVLETYAEPGTALKPFFEANAGEPDIEAVIVTNRECLDDPEFQRRLSDISWTGLLYLAAVERDGRFALFAHPHRQRPLCNAQISLDSLFRESAKKPSAQPLLRADRQHPNLPLIFSVEPFPLLLPIVGQIEKALPLPHGGGVACMRDGRLLRWEMAVLGAETLIDVLPPGQTVWLGMSHRQQRIHVLKYLSNHGSFKLSSWDVASRKAVTTDPLIWRDPPLRAYEREDILFVIAAHHIHAFDLQTGKHLNTIVVLPKDNICYTRCAGRYFSRSENDWHCLGYGAHGLQFISIKLPNLGNSKPLAVFDRAGDEMPWVLTNRGEVFGLEGKRILNLNVAVSAFEFSRDGERLLLNAADRSEKTGKKVPAAYVIDIQKWSVVRHLPVYGRRLLNPGPTVPTRNVRIKFDEMVCTPDGGLRLRGNKGVWHVLEIANNAMRIRPADTAPVDGVRKLEPLRVARQLGFKLRTAVWPNGRRAWLDSRGLLHLKPAAAGQPELSLVLADGPLAAWSSDGKLCGPPFFTQDRANTPWSALAEQFARFYSA